MNGSTPPADHGRMNDKRTPQGFVPLRVAAARLNVPFAWFKTEVDAGRIPFLRAGGRKLFDVDAVRQTLLQRQESAPREPHGDTERG